METQREESERSPREALPHRDSVFPSVSPVDGKRLPPLEATDLDDLKSVVGGARAAQKLWAAMPVRARASAIAPVKNRILSRASEIAELVRRECGKPIEEAALAEVLPNADLVTYWTTSIEELLEPSTLDLDPLAYSGKVG